MKRIVLFVLLAGGALILNGQKQGLVFSPAQDPTFWLRFTGAIQTWARYTEHNPGSAMAFGTSTLSAPPRFDLGIRRARFQMFGQLGARTFIYAQFGMNNFSALSARKSGAFFHDLTAEFAVIPGFLSAGGGLTGWSGLSRYASPSIASTLMYDAPLFQQTTNDVNEQFLRKLSLYAKGKAGILDYRVAVSKPMLLQMAQPVPDTALGDVAYRSKFSPSLPDLQYQAYIMLQFLEKENNLLPYTAGSYLGKKNVFNTGLGFIFQPNAMRHQDQAGAIRHTAMRLAAVDVFFDHRIQAVRNNAITAYLGIFNLDFGPNHIRTLGVMNPANTSTNPRTRLYSGAGNSFAMFGSGNIIYFQSGYKFRDHLFGDAGTLQAYADITYGLYQAFDDPMIVWNAGCNWLINGHNSRISVNYQERPVFREDPVTLRGQEMASARRGMVVLQYQVFF